MPRQLHGLRAGVVVAVDDPLVVHAPWWPARNRTFSTTLEWGAMTVPSASVVTAVNRLLTGGFDLRIVSGVPPGCRPEAHTAAWPTATAPKCNAAG